MVVGRLSAFWLLVWSFMCGCAAVAGGPVSVTEESSVSVIAFDCLMPLPADYVLTTGDPKRISLFKRGDTQEGGRIVISDSKSYTVDGDFETVSEKRIGSLSLVRLRYAGEFLGARARGEEIALLKNGEQLIAFYGGAVPFAERMARSCAEKLDW